MADIKAKDIGQPIQNPKSKIQNRGWQLDALALGALLFLLVLLMREALFSSTQILGDWMGDGATQFYPWRVFGYETWRSVGLPLWNPYSLMGMPFVANLQSALFYPTNLLCFILPIPIACNWSILINMFLSATFTYILARTLKLSRPGACLAALTYTLAANHVFRIYQGHWSFIEAMPWAPLLTLCAERLVRRRSLFFVGLGAVAVAMQIFSGMPQILFYSCIFAGLYFVVRLFICSDGPTAWRERAVRVAMFAAMFPLGALLGAAQLFPAMQLAQMSSRAERMALWWASEFALPPENLLTLVVPHLFGPAISGADSLPYWGRWNFWEPGLYLGLVSLLLFLAAIVTPGRRRWWPLAIPAAFFFLLSLGDNGVLLGLVYGRVPGFDYFRVPGRALSLVGLSVGIMAGMGLDVVLAGEVRSCRRIKWILGAFAAVAVLVALCVLTSQTPRSWADFQSAFVQNGVHFGMQKGWRPDANFAVLSWQFLGNDVTRSAIFIAVAAIIALLPFRKPRARLGMTFALLLLAAVDLYGFDRDFMVTFDSRDRLWSDQVIADVQKQCAEQPFRVSTTVNWYRYACQPMMYRLCSLESIEPNVPARFHDFFWASQGPSLSIQRSNYQITGEYRPGLLDLAGLKYVVVPGPDSTDEKPTFRTMERTGAAPRAFIAHSYKVIADRKGQFEWLCNWNHNGEVLFEEEPREPCEPLAGAEPAPVFKRYDVRGADIHVSMKSAGFLTLTDVYYPGWVARVDGKLAKIHLADYLVRAVAVPAGEHTVKFEYACPIFHIGAIVSAAAWGVIICALFALFWRTRRPVRAGGRHEPSRPIERREPS